MEQPKSVGQEVGLIYVILIWTNSYAIILVYASESVFNNS